VQNGAIVLSGWDWPAHNVPERTAIALGLAGWRVLYCSNPSSFLRGGGTRKPSIVAQNVDHFSAGLVGHRLNIFPPVRTGQARLLTSQILKQAQECGLRQPIVIYPHGRFFVDLAREFRARGYFCVFLCMDYSVEWLALAQEADLVLAIPGSMFKELKSQLEEKVRRLPQFGPTVNIDEACAGTPEVLAELEQIPHPQLAYLGNPIWRLQTAWVREIFSAHPDWHFLTCGPIPGLQLPNCHNIGWVGPAELPAVLRSIDAGFMPYNCSIEFNRHCVPLKLFDYFAAGLPAVSAPLVNLLDYDHLIYFGDGARQLEQAVRLALAEKPDAEQREERRKEARSHSIGEMSRFLSVTLTEAAKANSAIFSAAPNPAMRALDPSGGSVGRSALPYAKPRE
jgi:hypothetical protein